MKELFNDLDNWTLIKYIGGVTIILSSIISFLAYFIKDYLLNKWKFKYETEVEVLKAKFTQNNSLVNNLTNSFSNIHLASNDKRILCLENLWKVMMELKNNLPPLVALSYKILTKEELINLPKSENKTIKGLIETFNSEKFIKKQLELTAQVELTRPFIGENLWIIYFTYQAFIGRLTLLIETGILNEKVEHWTDDKGFKKQILLNVINQKELDVLLKSNITAFDNVLNFLEYKALNDISEQITGKRMTTEALEHTMKLSELIKNTVA